MGLLCDDIRQTNDMMGNTFLNLGICVSALFGWSELFFLG